MLKKVVPEQPGQGLFSFFYIFFQQIIYCKLEDFIPFLEKNKQPKYFDRKKSCAKKLVPDPIAPR